MKDLILKEEHVLFLHVLFSITLSKIVISLKCNLLSEIDFAIAYDLINFK
jgi:hypothetical protein